MTIEDPIEFLHLHKNCIVNQRELGNDAQSFALALKAALRQDPDVILVGEMRDLETISTALTAAETGHLVFATLHTQDTAQTVDRIIDVFPPHQQQQVRVQLSVALQGIVTQQLLPTADGSGRDLLLRGPVLTPAVRNLIREGKTHQIYSVLQTSAGTGHAVDGRRPGAAGPRGQDHARARRVAVELPRRAAAADGRLRPDGGVTDAGNRATDMSTFAFKAVDLSGIPARGQVEAESKQAVTDQLRERGLIVLDIVEEKTGLDVRRPVRALQAHQGLRADGHDPPARHDGELGHVAPARLLRAGGATENKKLQERPGRHPARHRGRDLALRRAAPSTRTSFNDLYVAMAETGEAAGMLEDDARARCRPAREARIAEAPDPGGDGLPDHADVFAMVVMLALVAFLIPVFEKVFKDFGGDLPTITKFSVALSHLVTGRWYLLIGVTVGTRLRLQALEEELLGQAAVGPRSSSRCR